MTEFWLGFLWGAASASVIEVMLLEAAGLWIKYRNRKALRRLEARLHYPSSPSKL